MPQAHEAAVPEQAYMWWKFKWPGLPCRERSSLISHLSWLLLQQFWAHLGKESVCGPIVTTTQLWIFYNIAPVKTAILCTFCLASFSQKPHIILKSQSHILWVQKTPLHITSPMITFPLPCKNQLKPNHTQYQSQLDYFRYSLLCGFSETGYSMSGLFSPRPSAVNPQDLQGGSQPLLDLWATQRVLSSRQHLLIIKACVVLGQLWQEPNASVQQCDAECGCHSELLQVLVQRNHKNHFRLSQHSTSTHTHLGQCGSRWG